VLRLEGRDTLPLLHRISTQALLELRPDTRGRRSSASFAVGCSIMGGVVVTSDGAVWLLRPDAAGAELAAFIDRHVFRARLQSRTAPRSSR